MARFVPNAIVASALEDAGIERADAELARRMAVGVERLASYQARDGSWGWFEASDKPEDLTRNALMTAIVVDGLRALVAAGIEVDAVMRSRGVAAARRLRAKVRDLELIARLGAATGDVDPRLLGDAQLSSFARAELLRAQLAAGHAGAKATREALAAAQQADGRWPAPVSDGSAGWAVSEVEATAGAMLALAASDPGHPALARGAAWLASQRRGGYWRSTKDTALAIRAMLAAGAVNQALARSAGGERAKRKRPLRQTYRITVDGTTHAVTYDLRDLDRQTARIQLPDASPGERQLRVELEGATGKLASSDVDLQLTFHRQRPAARQRQAGPGGLRLAVSYDRSLTTLAVGDVVTATVRLTTDQRQQLLMIDVPIPAGCEVVRGSGKGRLASFEARHGRALLFVERLDEQATLSFKLRATQAGKYTVRPPLAVPMYDELDVASGKRRRAVITSRRGE